MSEKILSTELSLSEIMLRSSATALELDPDTLQPNAIRTARVMAAEQAAIEAAALQSSAEAACENAEIADIVATVATGGIGARIHERHAATPPTELPALPELEAHDIIDAYGVVFTGELVGANRL